jgi:hypothetical protein
MKFRVLFVLLTLVLALSSSLPAQAGACNNATIRGTYAFTIRGQVFLPDGSSLLITGVARTTFDGEGNITQLDAVADNGNVPTGWRSSTGTYSVNPDCTGAFTVTNDPQPPINALFLIAQSGNSLHSIVINQGFAVISDAERVNSPKE